MSMKISFRLVEKSMEKKRKKREDFIIDGITFQSVKRRHFLFKYRSEKKKLRGELIYCFLCHQRRIFLHLAQIIFLNVLFFLPHFERIADVLQHKYIHLTAFLEMGVVKA